MFITSRIYENIELLIAISSPHESFYYISSIYNKLYSKWVQISLETNRKYFTA